LDGWAKPSDAARHRSFGGYVSNNQRLEEVVLPLAILLIIIGIVLAVLVNYLLGIIVILIGLAMLLIPYFRGGTARRV
jgi:1,4-dihydroxy-2-naphthoate octaprenyltransferase